MDDRSLQLFQHLANSLHFAKSAKACHVSPSTLSRTIQRLEEELSCQLFVRDNRSVILSDAGNKLLLYVDQQFEHLDVFKRSLNQSQTELSGTLNIYCSVTASYSHLPSLLDCFRRAQPKVEINLDTGDAADGFDQVQNKKVDIAIAARTDNIAASIYFQTIASVPLAVIAPTTKCAVRTELQKENIDWQNIPIILPEHGVARQRFENWFRQKHVGRPKVYAQVSGHEALVSMIALGCGIGVAPLVVIDNSPVKDRVEILPNNYIKPFDLGLCCLKSRLDNPILAEFITISSKSKPSDH